MDQAEEIQRFKQMKDNPTLLRIAALRQAAETLRQEERAIYAAWEADELSVYASNKDALYEAHKGFINAMVDAMMAVSNELDQQADFLEQQLRVGETEHTEPPS
ncbi:hypothetical protein EI42_05753 [Thermosporothrix hazakensis]|jgi:hypothetical protein|uniref:Uncharacterized protein n=1 Tax=Thermosporothrix hazakensis TaxID=644383 RepID=A0A326U8T5_THEHA|nr:hypothetical protein [Thermosporothrix hazakensis]PZW20992.1 hypothetical protein EI42_05753 [Thermosporothrix hazakensis]GCE49275.1 hypothetical protein KTH_41440 [Thermosporothrix hazakensis]